MNDLNHIGRPGASEERRIASARRRNMPLQLGASERGEATEDISGPGGLRKSLKRLNSDEEIQWKTGPFSWELFARAWPDLAEFGFGLGWAWASFNMHNMEASMPISRCEPNSERYRHPKARPREARLRRL